MSLVTLSTLITRVRFLFNDLPTSNYSQREMMAKRPGNLFNGENTVFFLFQRRIVDLTMYDPENTVVLPAAFTLLKETGQIIFIVPPTAPYYVDYHWQKLTDDEILAAADMAAAAGGFLLNSVDTSQLDYCTKYILAFCYLSAASKAAEYYTMSAAGKQVSKSELFNHYTSLYNQTLAQAQGQRTDAITQRGQRETPAVAEVCPTWVGPYFGGS